MQSGMQLGPLQVGHAPGLQPVNWLQAVTFVAVPGGAPDSPLGAKVRKCESGRESAKLDLKPRVEPAEGDDPESFLGKGIGLGSLRKISPQARATPESRDERRHRRATHNTSLLTADLLGEGG